MLPITILIPVLAAVGLGLLPLSDRGWKWYTAISMLLTALSALLALRIGRSVSLFYLTEQIPLAFALDELGRFFVILITIMYTMIGLYAFEYLEHDARPRRFFIFLLASWGALYAAAMAGNLVSLYLCFEMATLSSMPLVLHEGTKEATDAAQKYLFYSIGGALLGLFAVMSVSYVAQGAFTPGGYLTDAQDNHRQLLLWASFLGIVGFGAKAGLYPLHGWLPTAHPVAPAPASALLSGLVAKAGVLAIIRLVYYSVGPDFLRGTWVQTAWMVLGLVTVFMGSMMAYREKVLKKRLAYSTVSQISYILLGLSLLCDSGLHGALLHVQSHAFAKGALFLCAGVIIHKLGKKRVDELKGLGQSLPLTCFCFFLASLSLVGIPPMGGFLSKWEIAQAALNQAPGAFAYIIPLMLLLSALLTAGYLFPVVVDAFFPERSETETETEKREPSCEPSLCMRLPLVVLCLGSLLVGLLGGWLAL